MGGERGPRDASQFENYDAWAGVNRLELLGETSAAQIKTGFFWVDL